MTTLFKRVLLLVPEGLTFDMLTQEQQAAINGVFGQYCLPMTGTIPHNGKVVCDAVTIDSFDPTHMVPLGLPFEALGLWQYETGEALIPLNEELMLQHLPPAIVYDAEGNEIGTEPPVLRETHSFAGMPKCFGE